MTKYITHWTVAFITALIMFMLHYNDSSVTETARLKQFDMLQQTDEPVLSQDVGIVTIDEAAIEKYGQWPWKRDVIADIIWKLREAGVGVIVLPILMSEDDRLGGDIALARITCREWRSNCPNRNYVKFKSQCSSERSCKDW